MDLGVEIGNIQSELNMAPVCIFEVLGGQEVEGTPPGLLVRV